MALSVDRILAGLGSGLTTFAGVQGQANRYKDEQAQQAEERQRQIERDALAKAVAEAQIGNLNADNARADYEMKGRDRAAKVNEVMGRIKLQRDEQTKAFDRFQPEKPAPLMNVAPGGTVFDPTTRQPVYKAPDRPAKPTDLPKPSIGAETAYGILPVLKQADQELDTLTGTDLGALVSRKGGMLGRYLLTPEQKQYNDAIDDFALQYTTAVHGKRANAETVHGIQNMLRIVPGDDQATVKRKVARRKEFLAAAERFAKSAQAYHASTNQPDAADQPTGSPADRWEELVAGGMDKDAATAQVRKEFPQ